MCDVTELIKPVLGVTGACFALYGVLILVLSLLA